MPPLLIAPSILAANFASIDAELRAVESAGADRVHVDVMDGRFVPSISLGPGMVSDLRKVTRLPFDVHLMIVEPERHIEAFVAAGADSVTVHAEACPHLNRVLQQIGALGKKAGVALNPHTTEDVLRYVLDLTDMVLVMTVNPGFGGQAFIPAVLPKLRSVRRMVDASGRPIHIEVDGGINPSTARQSVLAGADVLVAGTAIFHAPDYQRAIHALRHACE